jgi:hypothetical protein
MNLIMRTSRSLLPAAARLLVYPPRKEIIDVVRDRFFCHPSMYMVLPVSRGYCTSIRRPITQSAPRGYLHDPRQVTTAAAQRVHGGARFTVYRAYYTEIVPYTYRTHLVRWSPEDGREDSEFHYPRFKRENASRILDHHDTDWVRRILSKIVDAIYLVPWPSQTRSL